ncbi:hypothetical protein [Streptomyces sp. KMM 9044]|uniref:hypothetical protein n=1 Tax=Streptomyces sp. KMM 9044 TaxID=2744474 RepID=UPI002150BF4C|nr:hypothetical protein [Streptomyces sp. KMM 9044]WAX78619.1 hypothetical protein HUV60_013960 [Streptomyces sp. KMM 9044]
MDTLLRLGTEAQAVFLPAVAAQGGEKPDKPAGWAYRVSCLWTKYRLTTALLVVRQDHDAARWVQQPACGGPARMPAPTPQPPVAGPHDMPVIEDPEEARADLVPAGPAAVTHAAGKAVDEVPKALSAALRETPEDIADPLVGSTVQGPENRRAEHLRRNPGRGA